MFVINILGFASLGCFLSLHYKERLTTVAQTALGIWMLLLYGLAFFQKLSWIDGVSVAFLLVLLLYVWKKRLPVKDTVRKLADSPAILFVMTVIILSFLVKDRLVTSGDDLGVWGPEPKCLYMLDGFADKYMNLLIGYSAYHPGAMLIEWWTCHFSPDQFYEGLLFVGDWFIILCCVAPVFENLRVKRRWAVLLSFPITAILILLPSMYGSMNYTLIAEMPMSMVFAGCMLACFDGEPHSKSFRFLRFTVGLAFLMLIKESGILFALFILLFYFVLEGLKKEGKPDIPTITYGVGGFLLALVPTLVWRVYCTVYERSNVFSYAFDSTLNDIKSHTFTLTEDLPGYASSMLKAWLGQPLHGTPTIGLDLTPLAAAVLVLFLCWYCTRVHILKKPSALRFAVLYAIFLIVYMVMLLFMHTYIFNETQYLNPETMIYSVGRYTEPLFLGTFVYFIALLLRKKDGQKLTVKKWLLAAAVIFLCSNVELAKNEMISYAGANAQAYAVRAAALEQDQVSAFMAEIDAHFTEKDPARILWISDQKDDLEFLQRRSFWQILAPKTYTYYQVNASCRYDGELVETTKDLLKQFHFGYIYFDFSDSAEWEMSDTLIQSRTLYRVVLQDGEDLRLETLQDYSS